MHIPLFTHVNKDVNLEISDIQISREIILECINKIRVDKSLGPYDMYPMLLKEAKESVATALEIIFRLG